MTKQYKIQALRSDAQLFDILCCQSKPKDLRLSIDLRRMEYCHSEEEFWTDENWKQFDWNTEMVCPKCKGLISEHIKTQLMLLSNG